MSTEETKKPLMNKETAMMILILAGKYGVDAVKDLIKVWKDDTPITVESLEAMEFKFKDPSSYFEKK